MNLGVKPLSWLLVWSAAAGLAGGAAAAQDTAPAAASPASAPATAAPSGSISGPTKSTAQIDAGEPRANTSPGSSAARAAERGVPAPAGTPAMPPRTAAASGAPHAAGQKAPGAADRVDLSTATVTGDREQPKVMYIVPWKKPDIGDLSGKPMNSLLDEALAPIDRDEFKREVAYYDAVRADAPQNGASNTAAQGEK